MKNPKGHDKQRLAPTGLLPFYGKMQIQKKMNDQQEKITNEIKSVVAEIDQLKLMIKNLNRRIISNSDRLGMLAFLSAKKSRLLQSCSNIAGLAVV